MASTGILGTVLGVLGDIFFIFSTSAFTVWSKGDSCGKESPGHILPGKYPVTLQLHLNLCAIVFSAQSCYSQYFTIMQSSNSSFFPHSLPLKTLLLHHRERLTAKFKRSMLIGIEFSTTLQIRIRSINQLLLFFWEIRKVLQNFL